MSIIDSQNKGAQREIYFCEYIEEETAKTLIKSITEINKYDDEKERTVVGYQREPIKLYLTTGGGDALITIALFDHIKYSRTPIHMYVSGECCSGGFIILGAAEKVFAYKHTFFMYHQLSAEMYYENLEKQKQIVDSRVNVQKVLDSLVLENTNIKKEQLKSVNRSQKDWWMDAEKALELGVIDEIIE